MAKEVCPRCGESMSDDSGCWCGINLTFSRPTPLEARDIQIAQLTTENERLKRVVEQAIALIDLLSVDWCNKGKDVIRFHRNIIPDLYAHREADRGEFRLQVGDMVVLRESTGKWKVVEFYQEAGHIEQHVLLHRGTIQFKRITVREIKMKAKCLLSPTPNGMVQVWRKKHDPD